MSTHSLSNFGTLMIKLMTLALAVCFLGDLANAQAEPYPKWEVFGGYSFLYPNARLHAINPFIDANQEAINKGLGFSVEYNFTRWFALTGDVSFTPWATDENAAQLAMFDDARFYNVSIGPKLTYRRKHFAPFAEALVGWHRLAEDKVPLIGSSDTFGFMLGAGLDVPISKHFGLRLLRADYVFSNHQYEPEALVDTTGVR